METWLDIEQRFRSIASLLSHSRLDVQWGAAGEHWRIAGLSDQLATQQFEVLASFAGQSLERVLKPEIEAEKLLLNIPDARIRWYNLLKQSSPTFGNLSYGEQLNEDGSSGGFIFTGSLHKFADASANLCLSLHSSHALRETPQSKWKWFHDNYGKSLIIGAVLAMIGAAIKLFF